MNRDRREDSPWRRLPWLLPGALLLSLLGIAGFLLLLAGAPAPPRPTPPIEMQLVELPPSQPSRLQETTPPPPEPPPLEPPPTEPPRPAPPPEPEPIAVPEPPPPAAAPPPPPARQAPPPRPTPPRPAPPPPVTAPAMPPAPGAAASVAAPPLTASPGAANSAARAIFQPRPEIPEELRRRALNMVAVARFHVAASGAAEIELIATTPDPLLNRSLLETLKRWRFFPALVDGKPVSSTIDVRIPLSVQ